MNKYRKKYFLFAKFQDFLKYIFKSHQDVVQIHSLQICVAKGIFIFATITDGCKELHLVVFSHNFGISQLGLKKKYIDRKIP